MLNNLLTRLLGRSNKETIADILAIPDNRETLLGVRRVAPPSPEQIIGDINRVVNYARTEDYSIWAKEAWSDAIECLDKIMDPKTPPEEIDFYRGGFAKCVEMLRISYRALKAKEEVAQYAKENKK